MSRKILVGLVAGLAFLGGIVVWSAVAEAGGVGTPANFENSGIYGGCAKSFAIDPTNSDVLYVGMGSGYGVYKSTNAGTSWSGNSAFEDEGGWVEVRGLAIAPSNSDIVFAASGDILKKSIDGGSTWTTLSNYTGSEIQSIVIHPTDPDIVYLGSGSEEAGTDDDAIVWKTVDGGLNWTSSPLDDGGASSPKDTLVGKVTIDPNDPDNTVYAVTGSVVYTEDADLLRGNIFKSTNGGGSWAAKYPDGGAGGQGWFEDVCVDPTDSNIVFAAGKVGIVKSTDGGDTWTTVYSAPGNGLCSVVVDKDDDNIVYAATPRDDKIYKSTDGGTNWNEIYSAGVDIKLFIDPTTTTTIYAIDSVGVRKSTDSGSSWAAVNKGIDAVEVLSSTVDPSDSKIMYVGTESGYIVKTTDKGSNWSVIHTEFYGIPALAIDPNNTDVIYAGDRGTSILKSTDGGDTWADMILDGPEYINIFGYVNPTMVMVDNSSNVYICQSGQTGSPDEGNIYKSADGGDTWDTGLLPVNNPVLSMAIKPSDSNTIYVGRNDQGATPDYRGVVKTTDGGNNWTSVGLTGEIIRYLVIDPNNEDVVYAGTEANGEEGKIYKSTNAGDSWTDITPSGSEGDFDAITIDSSDSNIVYAGTNEGYLYKSTDGGSSWTLLTDDFISVTTLMVGSLYAGTGGGLYKYTAAEEEEETTTTTEGDGGGGGCFIATAAYDTPMAKEVKNLCKFRDQVLLKDPLGRQFVKFYYAVSPPIADFIRNKPGLKAMVREALKPLVEVTKEITK